MKLLEMKHVGKSFGELEVLKDISMEVEEGEVVAIIGPSGSGKSTLLRCATLLETMDKGVLKYCGEAATDNAEGEATHYVSRQQLAQLKNNFGLVFQNFNLFPHYSVLKNVTDAPIHVQKRDRDEVYKEARELLRKVGLAEKENSYPGQLSGGQKQRLSIARAIAKHPDVYIFDDSFSALDYKTDTVLRSALKEKTTDSVVLIVAQRISTILHAEQIIVLDDGKIVGKGTHEELLKTCDTYYQIAASQLSESELKEAMKEED